MVSTKTQQNPFDALRKTTQHAQKALALRARGVSTGKNRNFRKSRRDVSARIRVSSRRSNAGLNVGIKLCRSGGWQPNRVPTFCLPLTRRGLQTVPFSFTKLYDLLLRSFPTVRLCLARSGVSARRSRGVLYYNSKDLQRTSALFVRFYFRRGSDFDGDVVFYL